MCMYVYICVCEERESVVGGGCEERENGVGRTKKERRKEGFVCVCERERERAGERECVWLL